jgi:hypothetical protein
LAALGVVSLASVAQADEKMSAVGTALSSTVLSGYVDTSMQWNLGTGNNSPPAYSYGGTTKADGFNLNVVDLNLEKDADASDAWGTGYKVELWAGPDAGAPPFIKNAYVDLHTPVGNGLEWKIGVWDSPIGYEVADSPQNPNFTRSYGFTMEPTTHTGVQADYTFNEMVSAMVGIANTDGEGPNNVLTRAVFPNGAQHEEFKTYMGSVTLTAPKDWGWVAGSSGSFCIINGFDPAIGAVGRPADATHLYAGITMNTPLKELKVGASFDYLDVGPQALTAAPGGDVGAYQNNYAIYTSYQLTEKLSVNGRGEYFRQSKFLGGLGLPDKVIELTATVQYDLWKNVLSRIELRWDHQAGDLSQGNSNPAFGNAGIRGQRGLNNSYIFLANIVYKF